MAQAIRALSFEDVAELDQLLAIAYKLHGHPIGGHWNARVLAEALREGAGLGVIDGSQGRDKIVSFMIYRMLGGVFDMTVVATDPEFQRRGLMRRLFQHVLLEMPVERLWLEVHEANTPAVQFYESFGFQLQGRRLGYYRDGGAALLYSFERPGGAKP
jgi:ribosomal-protein-alanine N-acetyltransferase